MNSGFKKLPSVFLSLVQTHYIPVRFRYYADKIAAGPYSKKFGYEDKIFTQGLLPRLKDADRLPGPVYKPSNVWSPEKVKRGQNDYIDLLGGGKLKPSSVSYEIPKWLRGKKGNEMQLLLAKQKFFSKTLYQYENPTTWKSMERRFKYLYRYLNRKTKTGFSPRQ